MRGWLRSIDYFWLRPGLFRKLVPAYLDYFRPGFHPNDIDSTPLLDGWRHEYAASPVYAHASPALAQSA